MTPNDSSKITVEFVSEALQLDTLEECLLMIGLPARLNTGGPACVVKAFDEIGTVKAQRKELCKLNPAFKDKYKRQFGEIVDEHAKRIHPEIVRQFKVREERAREKSEKLAKKHRS